MSTIPYAETDPGTYEYSVCPRCGGRYVFHSFMVADGEDDVMWDSEEWCDDCRNLIETNTEYGLVKDEQIGGSVIL